MATEAAMQHLFWRFWFATPRVFLYPGLYYRNRRIIPLPGQSEPPQLAEFPEQTVAVAKQQPEYRPLPAYQYRDDVEGKIVFCWKLNWHHRLKVLRTGVLWHQVMTFNTPLQPQLLLTDKPEMPPHNP